MLTVALLFLSGWFNWETLKTDDFTVVYKKEYYWEAMHTLRNLEYYKSNVRRLIGDGQRNLPVVIEDIGAISNGFANPVFHNVHVFTHAPGFTYGMQGIESWYRSVSVHEYAHIVHLSRTQGLARILTDVFGSLFAPNIYSPGWITEGITVLNESRVSPYEGRLNEGFFDSYIALRAQAEDMPSIVEATNTPLEFPFGAYYLYGGEFMDFLAHQYGEDKLADLFGRYGSYFWAPLSGIMPFIGLDIAARRVYGKSFPRLFEEWQEYEQARHVDWRPAGTRITEQGWYIYSLTARDGNLYYVRYRPIKLDGFYSHSLVEIIEMDPEHGKERVITSLNRTITSPLRLAGDKLYYTTRQLTGGYANVYNSSFGLVSNLHVRDLGNGEDKIVLTDEIRGFCILPDGRVLYSKDKAHGFGSELWVCDGDEKTMLFETELLVNELAANDDYLIAVARHDFENWNIYLLNYDLQRFRTLVATPWIEGSITLRHDTLFFTANYDKTYGIYMYDLDTGTFYQLTEFGYADYGVVIGESMYYLGMKKQGFDIYKVKFEPRYFRLPLTEDPEKPDLESMQLEVRRGGYGDVVKTLVPAFRMPFVLPTEADFSAWAYGLIFLGGDATNENIYAGFLARASDETDPLFNLFWQSKFFAPLDITLFYDYKHSLEYTLAYPVLLSLEHGLSNLTIILDGRIFDGLSRNEFAPGLAVRFQYPTTTLSGRLSFPFERQSWGSDINRSAQEVYLGLRQMIKAGELRLRADAYVDHHDPEIPSFSLRGYEPISSPAAISLTAEYGRRLCKVRWGLWNPNLYFEDLFWTIFADWAWIDGGDTYYSVGCELRLETKTGFGFLQVVPKLGVALTQDKRVAFFFGISPNFPI